jgi:hypothetical protein
MLAPPSAASTSTSTVSSDRRAACTASWDCSSCFTRARRYQSLTRVARCLSSAGRRSQSDACRPATGRIGSPLADDVRSQRMAGGVGAPAPRTAQTTRHLRPLTQRRSGNLCHLGAIQPTGCQTWPLTARPGHPNADKEAQTADRQARNDAQSLEPLLHPLSYGGRGEGSGRLDVLSGREDVASPTLRGERTFDPLSVAARLLAAVFREGARERELSVPVGPR